MPHAVTESHIQALPKVLTYKIMKYNKMFLFYPTKFWIACYASRDNWNRFVHLEVELYSNKNLKHETLVLGLGSEQKLEEPQGD